VCGCEEPCDRKRVTRARFFEEDLRAVWTCAAPTFSYDEASIMSCPVLSSTHVGYLHVAIRAAILIPLSRFTTLFLDFSLFVHDCTIPWLAATGVQYISCMSTTSRDRTIMSIRETTLGPIFPLNIFPYVSPVSTQWGIWHYSNSRISGMGKRMNCTEATLAKHKCPENITRSRNAGTRTTNYSKASSALRRTRRRTFFL